MLPCKVKLNILLRFLLLISILIWGTQNYNLNLAHASSNLTIIGDDNLPINRPVPGGLAILPLDLNNIERPIVFFEQKQVLVVKYKSTSIQPQQPQLVNWIALVAIPMNIKPGLHKIRIYLQDPTNSNLDADLEKTFIISAMRYPVEKLKLKPNLVNPSYGEQVRINKEKDLITKAYQYRSNQIPNLILRKPVDGRKSSPFGLQRILNGQHKGFHSGMDLKAPIGTPIYAASSGKIILTGDFFYIGSAVFIDHGQGLITNYSHLDTINVTEGQQVDSDTIIGTVGTTGRSTGPHLHWAVSLNDVRIDPELFLNP